MMDDNIQLLNANYGKEKFPIEIIDKIRDLNVNGLYIKEFGGLGLNTLETFAIHFEIFKKDLSIGNFFMG